MRRRKRYSPSSGCELSNRYRGRLYQENGRTMRITMVYKNVSGKLVVYSLIKGDVYWWQNTESSSDMIGPFSSVTTAKQWAETNMGHVLEHD
jgi:hypothetical protein